MAHFERDFSDGFLVAEILQHYFPYLVDSRNFITCSKLEDRVAQWRLNRFLGTFFYLYFIVICLVFVVVVVVVATVVVAC